MPPCHGGDRRFESGRARQTKNPILVIGFFVWADLSAMRTGARVAAVRSSRTRTGIYSEHAARSNHPVEPNKTY
jgi:hypothetical protein